jgi:hypothetical protein
MIHNRHISNFELDLYFASGEPDGAIEQHVQACERCSGYLGELESLRGGERRPLHTFNPASARASDAPANVAAGSAARSRSARRVFGGLAGAALAVLAVGYATSRVLEDSTYVAVKGSPAVQLLVERSGHVEAWDGKRRVRAGDVLAIRVACERFALVNVVARPQPGQPAPARLSEVPCPRQPDLALPFTLRVDDEPGQESFAVVLSTARLGDARLLEAVQEGTRSLEVWVTPFDLEKEAAR